MVCGHLDCQQHEEVETNQYAAVAAQARYIREVVLMEEPQQAEAEEGVHAPVSVLMPPLSIQTDQQV